MNVCLLVLGIALGCFGEEPAPAPEAASLVEEDVGLAEEDAWLAEDKVQHFTASLAATTMAYGGARTLMEPDPAMLAAGATALGLGIAKEVRDARAGGPFSLKDMVWDAAGVALGLTIANGIR